VGGSGGVSDASCDSPALALPLPNRTAMHAERSQTANARERETDVPLVVIAALYRSPPLTASRRAFDADIERPPSRPSVALPLLHRPCRARAQSSPRTSTAASS